VSFTQQGLAQSSHGQESFAPVGPLLLQTLWSSWLPDWHSAGCHGNLMVDNFSQPHITTFTVEHATVPQE